MNQLSSISVKTSLINSKLGDFENLGVLFLCGLIVAYPIIYRIVPSPLRFEIRQCPCFMLLMECMFCYSEERPQAAGSLTCAHEMK